MRDAMRVLYRKAFKEAFSEHVGQGAGRMSTQEVSRLTGIGHQTLLNYGRGESFPEVPELYALKGVLPASFRLMIDDQLHPQEHGEFDADELAEHLAEVAAAAVKFARLKRLKGHCHVTLAKFRQALRPLAGIGAIISGRRKLARAA